MKPQSWRVGSVFYGEKVAWTQLQESPRQSETESNELNSPKSQAVSTPRVTKTRTHVCLFWSLHLDLEGQPVNSQAIVHRHPSWPLSSIWLGTRKPGFSISISDQLTLWLLKIHYFSRVSEKRSSTSGQQSTSGDCASRVLQWWHCPLAHWEIRWLLKLLFCFVLFLELDITISHRLVTELWVQTIPSEKLGLQVYITEQTCF